MTLQHKFYIVALMLTVVLVVAGKLITRERVFSTWTLVEVLATSMMVYVGSWWYIFDRLPWQ